ncbi:MAG: RNA polymerase sigma factor RpoD/SigA [Bacteroidales bacterium]|nr:RNA polymerase sigma factor RpoD/SigA [Bacteroidales bacterium]
MRQLKISKQITDRGSGLDRYLSDIAKEELLTAEEEVELARRIKSGDRVALDKLVRANLRFVVSVAKQYQNQGLSLQDLINEGNVGLVKAAQRFDETRGFKFISYAVWWIRQSILQAVAEQARIIRLPMNQVGALAKVKKASAMLEQKLQRRPTVKEIADSVDLAEDKVEQLLNLNTRAMSTDAPLDEQNDDANFLDIFVQEDQTKTDSAVEQESASKAISRSLDMLSEKERTILCMYYGLGTSREYSLEEIAMKLNLSRERTRQIRDRTLKRLRSEPNSPLLQLYMNQ